LNGNGSFPYSFRFLYFLLFVTLLEEGEYRGEGVSCQVHFPEFFLIFWEHYW
jgi:hypothetical protein